MNQPFVTSHVAAAALAASIDHLNSARGTAFRRYPAELDSGGWSTVAFMAKSDLRARLQPYPATGPWLTSLSSSGTTDNPVYSPWSEADQRIADRTAERVHRRGPAIAGASCAVIAPDSPLAVVHSMRREIELCHGRAVVIASTSPKRIRRALLEQRIEVVFTLPLVASRIGEYFQTADGGAPRDVHAVFCGGDILSAARQRLLTRMWNARVLNMFGCSELFGPVAGPSEHGEPLEWCCDQVAVEVLDRQTLAPCGPGQRGVMVLTSLWPKASPLVRYWTDDEVEVVATAGQGPFTFHFVGRPITTLTTANTLAPLRDIDELLLSDGRCGPEWSLTHCGGEVHLEIEVADRSDASVRDLRSALAPLLGAAAELRVRSPGSLDRSSPKFAVRRSG